MTTDLEALRALEEAATPGPWGVCHVPRKGLSFVEQRNEHGVATADVATLALSHSVDAALIVAMRNALPRLLAIAEAAERAREALKIAQGWLDDEARFSSPESGAGQAADTIRTAHASLTAVLGEKT